MKWVKCASAVESSVPLWVNLEQVIAMYKSEQGTEIKGADGFSFVVTDTPEDILQRCQTLRS